jgi:hypothetical protein
MPFRCSPPLCVALAAAVIALLALGVVEARDIQHAGAPLSAL